MLHQLEYCRRCLAEDDLRVCHRPRRRYYRLSNAADEVEEWSSGVVKREQGLAAE